MSMYATGLIPEGDDNRPNQPKGGRHGTPPRVLVSDLPNTGGKFANAPPGATLPLALHHVVPWEHLWKFWNEMCKSVLLGRRDFLAILGVAKPTTAPAFKNIATARINNASWYFDVTICWGE